MLLKLRNPRTRFVPAVHTGLFFLVILGCLKARADEQVATTGSLTESRMNETEVSVNVLTLPADSLKTPSAWPRFHGPNYDQRSTETGLLGEWPEGGPELLWKIETLGTGYSSIAIVDGTIYTMGDRPVLKDGQPTDEKAQYVLAYDLKTQEERWATPIGPPHSDGPRCTPTVADGRVYVVGTEGDVACLNADDGSIVWKKSLVEDFGGKMMSVWKFSESPLVNGDLVICTPGVADAALVALNKSDGELAWKTAIPPLGNKGKEGAAYCSAVPAEIHDVKQYVQVIGKGIIGVDAGTGKFLWGYNDCMNPVAACSNPVIRDDLVFVTTSYGTGSTLIRIVKEENTWSADKVYELSGREFENHHGGMVLVGDYLFGGSGRNQGDPTCIEFASGKIAWQEKAPQKGSAAIIYADGRVIFRYERGLVVMFETSPDGYRVQGEFNPPRPESAGNAWAHPVILDGKLFFRDDTWLLCYEIGKD